MKYNRHAKILEIIENHEIETQDELAEKLGQSDGCDSGNNIQDIKELRLGRFFGQ